MRARIRKIEFNADSYHFHYQGADGYGHPPALSVVTFEISESDGDDYIDLAVSIDEPANDYNELVETAWRLLAIRLRRFQGIADDIEKTAAANAEEAERPA